MPSEGDSKVVQDGASMKNIIAGDSKVVQDEENGRITSKVTQR